MHLELSEKNNYFTQSNVCAAGFFCCMRGIANVHVRGSGGASSCPFLAFLPLIRSISSLHTRGPYSATYLQLAHPVAPPTPNWPAGHGAPPAVDDAPLQALPGAAPQLTQAGDRRTPDGTPFGTPDGTPDATPRGTLFDTPGGTSRGGIPFGTAASQLPHFTHARTLAHPSHEHGTHSSNPEHAILVHARRKV